MKTTYTATLTNGQTEQRVSKIPDYVVGIQGINWEGNLRLIGLSRSVGNAAKTAKFLSDRGMQNVKLIDISRQ